MTELHGKGTPVTDSMWNHHFWTQHGVHSPPLADEVALLRQVAHTAWHLLDEGGEQEGEDGLYVVSALDWCRLAEALDAAGWSADASANARSTGARTVRHFGSSDAPC